MEELRERESVQKVKWQGVQRELEVKEHELKMVGSVDGWIGGWLDRWMVGLVDGWIGGWLDWWMVGLVDGWIGGWLDRWMVGSVDS